jgi:type IV pilus assembly protein PilA
MTLAPLRRPRSARGFTLIELMIVISIIGIMATMAVPSYQDRILRAQVSEGLALAQFAQQAVQAEYTRSHVLPANNAAAGLPPADRIVGNYVTSLAVHDGGIVMTYGNRSNRHLEGQKLSLRPATVEGYPQVPIAWVCGAANVPARMQVHGADQTTLSQMQLPLDCRAGPPPATSR